TGAAARERSSGGQARLPSRTPRHERRMVRMATRREMQNMATPVETDNTSLMSTPDGSTTLQTDRGKVVIANGVVAKIAGLAAREIDGVHDLVSTSLLPTVTALARGLTRQGTHDLGVAVEVGQREAAVDLRLIAEYGASIPAVADAVRRNVTQRVE